MILGENDIQTILELIVSQGERETSLLSPRGDGA